MMCKDILELVKLVFYSFFFFFVYWFTFKLILFALLAILSECIFPFVLCFKCNPRIFVSFVMGICILFVLIPPSFSRLAWVVLE